MRTIGGIGASLGGSGLALAGALALLAAAPAGAATPAARLTAAVGSTSSGGSAVEQRGALEDGSSLETGEDGQCSLLLDEDALMEVCGGTSMRLTRKDGRDDGPRVVELDRGEIRMVVEPRLGEERIEIHTPAAIATILGTVLHVSVDALGVTTITSTASKVLVQSSDPKVQGETTIDGGQKVVINPGEPPQREQKVDPKELASLGGCLIDFHAAALASDRASSEQRTIEELTEQDIIDGDLPEVGAGEGEGVEQALNDSLPDPSSDPPYDPTDEPSVFSADPPNEPPDLEEPPPPGGGCGPLPGEGCGPF